MARRITALLLALIMGALLLSGCGVREEENTPETAANTETGDGGHPALDDKLAQGPSVEAQPLSAVVAATSYEQVRDAFLEAQRRNPMRGVTASNGGMAVDDADIPTETAAEAEGGAGEDYGTNVQVAGVDEADTLKNDGEYLYAMNSDGFRIVRAAGAETAQVSVVHLAMKDEDAYSYPEGLFIGENRVALLYGYSSYGWDEDDNWYDENRCGLAIYDVTDKANPVLLADVGQDGYYRTARLLDGVIYLVSNHYVGWPDGDDVRPYIPCVYADGAKTLLEAERIFLCPQVEQTSYTVVGAYRISDGTETDACAFTDSSDTVYMNGDALYLARSVLNETASEPYQENQYTVVDYVREEVTEVKRIALQDGELELTGSATVSGRLLNQFSMDVYDGKLRLATTTYTDAYSVYTDEAYGWENYVWYDGEQNNRLSVLDGELKEIGKLEDIVADEQIYAVRFLGEVGYVVTYESIDPVFTIDLSDPTEPKLESALEVPGVSQYLHPYGEGRLFGFGQAVDENAWSEGLQLSMYDVSDPKAVSLESRLVLDESYSEALYDHHAILVLQGQNLIGFAAENYDDWETSYILFRYEDGSFVELGRYLMDFSAYDMRSAVVDGCLYLCGRYMTEAVSLDTMELLASFSDLEG